MNRHYDIAFVGVGSIGKRHLCNLCRVIEHRWDTLSVDLYRTGKGGELPTDARHVITGEYNYNSVVDSSKHYDAVFITNPTSLHYEAVVKFIGRTRTFFIEKPVFSTIEIDGSVLNQLDRIRTYVACPLRYNPVISYVKENISPNSVLSVRAISSSYLPDWRPGQDYRKCYSAHRDMGGGVDIDLIHEWDYLTWIFGIPQTSNSLIDRVSNLEIDSPDIAVYIGKIDNIVIELHLDYFGRSAIRNLELFLDDDTLCCDILKGRVEYLRSGRSIQFDNSRNEYQTREIEHFVNIIDSKIESDSDVRHALKVMKITQGLK